MKSRLSKAFARFDPAHVFDGLFVPTGGKKRGRLLVPPRDFGHIKVGFQGFEQLGADDQSTLLAICAQLGIDGLIIDPTPQGPIARQLRLDLIPRDDDGAPVACKKTTLRSILIDAGYHHDIGTKKIMESLNRLRSAQIREIDTRTGWDRASNIVSVNINKATGDIFVAVNPRLTSAIFYGQHVVISLAERRHLETEVAKILHCWLSSVVRLGKPLGGGRGVHLDTLGPHVWGPAWDDASRQVRSRRRGLLRDALDEISDSTRSLHDVAGSSGWIIDIDGSGLVHITRPKVLPTVEGALGVTLGQYCDQIAEQYY